MTTDSTFRDIITDALLAGAVAVAAAVTSVVDH